MQIEIIFLFLFVFLVSYFKNNEKNQLFLLLLLSLVLILVAGFRNPESVNDYENYVAMYDYDYDYVEPSFKLISNFVRTQFDNPIYLFLIYAILGVSLKVYATKRLTDFYFLSIAIYVSNFYILHELTQIRVGVASAILLLMIKPIYDRNWKLFSILCIIALSFHYTTLLLIPLYFINTKQISKVNWLLIVPISYIVHYTGLNLSNLIGLIPFENIQRLWDVYSSDPEFDSINVINSVQLLRWLISSILIFFSHKIIENNQYFILLVKVYIIGIISFVLFIDLPVLSFRISELLYIVEIILIPFLLYTTEKKVLVNYAIFFIGAFFLYYNLIFAKMILT